MITLFHFSQITVGHADMTSQQIEENVMTAFTKIFDTVPGGSQNLKHAHLKSEKSPALPFYISSGNYPSIQSGQKSSKSQNLFWLLDMSLICENM